MFDNKKVKMKLDNGQMFVCTVKVIDDSTVETITNNATYYIHPSSVKWVREYGK
jgi:hypothetical protein